MINDDAEIDIYKINIHEKINKVKILMILLFLFILICLILIIKHTITIINGYKVYKQYEIQLQAIMYQDQQKQAEIEAEKERKRQEKIPKLTETRKSKYTKYISIRWKKSFFNI